VLGPPHRPLIPGGGAFDLALVQSRDLAEEDLDRIVANRPAALRVQAATLRHHAETADRTSTRPSGWCVRT
jgi:hypothetical protein